MNLKTRYMEIILHVVMNIQEGESLSINTNPGHYDFAQELAELAAETTLQPVNIVVITEGKPGDVISINPTLHELLSTPPIRAILLRLDDTEDREWNFSADPNEIIKQPALLQKTGNLAPPQLDVQIAPWSIVPVPGLIWAHRLLGPRATEQDLYHQFAKIFMLSEENPQQAWKEHAALIDSRLAAINRLDISHLTITTEAGTNLKLSAVEESRWRGGVRKLPNGRAFLPQIPLNRISMLANRVMTEGVVYSSKPFPLLGGQVEGARLEFSHGSVVSFSAEKGEHLLSLALSVDEGARKLGECSLVDQNTPLTELADFFGYVGFDENALTSLTLGMGEAYHLEALDTYTDEFELQEKTGCNVSSIRFRLPIGDDQLSVVAHKTDGTTITIMENGAFLL